MIKDDKAIDHVVKIEFVMKNANIDGKPKELFNYLPLEVEDRAMRLLECFGYVEIEGLVITKTFG